MPHDNEDKEWDRFFFFTFGDKNILQEYVYKVSRERGTGTRLKIRMQKRKENAN